MSEPSYPSYPGDLPEQATAAYGPPPPGWVPTPRPEPVKGLTTAALVLAVALTAFEVVEAALAWGAQSDYLDAADRGEDAIDVFTAYDAASIAYLPLLVAAYVVTCLWLYRARTNVEVLDPWRPHARSRGWVWGSWVCPVVSLWFPFQVVRDVLRSLGRSGSGALLGWWWAAWLAGLLSGQVAGQLIGFGEIDRDLVSAVGAFETANAAFLVVALVLWIRIVLTIRRDQTRVIDQAMKPSGW